MLNNIIRLLQTVKYLKLQQIYFRIKYRVTAVKQLTPAELSTRPRLPAMLIVPKNYWRQGGSLSINAATFLNRTETLQERTWNDQNLPKLWLYNLHYFDDLTSLSASTSLETHRALVNRWIAENPPVLGNGWEPYTISLRLVNLIYWCKHQGVCDNFVIDSIHQQAYVLRQRCEYHILANHLFANAKALLVYAIVFHDDEMLTFARKLFIEQLEEQFLSDGAHYERSPMYHCILLTDVLEIYSLCLANNIDKELQERLVVVISRGVRWLRRVSHPDGNISYFNDSSLGVAPSPEYIFNYAQSVGVSAEFDMPRMIEYGVSGLASFHSKSCSVIADFGNIQPSYQPGHAHAESLSFEMSILGKRLLVNTGVSCYGVGPQRDYERSTLAHNTLVMNNQNSSDVWSGFRVGKRATVAQPSISNAEDSFSIEASHDGYSSWRQKRDHTRRLIIGDRVLRVRDTFKGRADSLAVVFKLHPTAEVVDFSRSNVTVVCEGIEVTISVLAGGFFKLESSEYAIEFGKLVDTSAIMLHIGMAQAAEVYIKW